MIWRSLLRRLVVSPKSSGGKGPVRGEDPGFFRKFAPSVRRGWWGPVAWVESFRADEGWLGYLKERKAQTIAPDGRGGSRDCWETPLKEGLGGRILFASRGAENLCFAQSVFCHGQDARVALARLAQFRLRPQSVSDRRTRRKRPSPGASGAVRRMVTRSWSSGEVSTACSVKRAGSLCHVAFSSVALVSMV